MELVLKDAPWTKKVVRIGEGSNSPTLEEFTLGAKRTQAFEDAKNNAYTDSNFFFYHYKKKAVTITASPPKFTNPF